MEIEILKEAVEYGQSREWIAHAGRGITHVSRAMRVSCAQLSLRSRVRIVLL